MCTPATQQYCRGFSHAAWGLASTKDARRRKRPEVPSQERCHKAWVDLRLDYFYTSPFYLRCGGPESVNERRRRGQRVEARGLGHLGGAGRLRLKPSVPDAWDHSGDVPAVIPKFINDVHDVEMWAPCQTRSRSKPWAFCRSK